MTQKVKIWIGIGTAVLMVGSFFAGMEYQSYRIRNAIVDAFTGISTDGDGDKKAPPKKAKKVAVGTEFSFTLPYGDPGADKATIKVISVTCGLSVLKAPDEYTEDAKAEEGMSFCVAKGTARNEGTKPIDPPGFGSLVTDKGEFAADESVNSDFGVYADTTNPGKAAKFSSVYAVPTEAKTTGVYYSGDSSLDDGLTLVEVD